MPSRGRVPRPNRKGSRQRPAKAARKPASGVARGVAQREAQQRDQQALTLQDQPSLSADKVQQLQRALGNRAVNRLLGPALVQRRAAAPAIQRHSDAALKAQITAAALEDEETVQTKPAGSRGRSALVQRHPMKPNVEAGHEASFGKRKTADMIRIATDPAHIGRVRNALKSVIVDNLVGAEQATKLEQIKNVQWELDDNVAPANPAQVKGGVIKLFYYHPNWYKPDGSVRVEFTKSTVLHEGLHFISHNHAGFQQFVPQPLNVHHGGSLAGADTLDEAVTDKIGSELAEKVLGAQEAYTTNYWNMEARRGLDYHLTFKGLELLATGEPQLWLGKMIDIIVAKTGLQWPEIKRAYLTDQQQDPQIRQKIEDKRKEISAEWKAQSESALKKQLGQDAIPKAEWENELKAAVQAADAEAAQRAQGEPGQIEAGITKAQIKAVLDAKLQAKFGAPQEIVASVDPRTSSLDDWKVVRDNTPHINPPAGEKKFGAWNESATETKWGEGGKSPNIGSVKAAEQEEKEKNPQTAEYTGSRYHIPIPDLKLKSHVEEANRLLGYLLKKHPMGWIIVPHSPMLPPDRWIKAGAPFSSYPAEAVSLLKQYKPELMGESLTSLAGANPEMSARAVIAGMGGGGYEANGEFGALNIEHVNLATVVHEMGHHKQYKEQGFGEHNINQVKGVPPLLDLHNILISENKLALRELQKNPRSDPYVRLRYTESPVRLKISDWRELAKDQKVEGESYKRFKARLEVKRGPVYDIVRAIEAELANHPQLYPGQVPILFKNFMVDEIQKTNKRPMLELEKLTDIGHK